MASIIGGPFKGSIDQLSVTAYIISQNPDDFPSALERGSSTEDVLSSFKLINDPGDSYLLLLHRTESKDAITLLAGSDTQRVSMFRIVKRTSESMQENDSLWCLSRVSQSEYILERTAVRHLMPTHGEVILSDLGIFNSDVIQRTMKELELSTSSIFQGLDLCPNNEASKLMIESMHYALFAEAIHLPLKGAPDQPHEHDQELLSAPGLHQRKYSDKTGMLITIPHASAARANVPSAHEIEHEYNKKRRRDHGLHLAATAPANNTGSIQKLPVQTMKLFSAEELFFVVPEDTEYLTDYYFLLFGQVIRGVMNEKDLAKSSRSKCIKLDLYSPGMRCRHCGGNERGSYFPSNSKNLQACTSTLHTHLMKCEETPASVISALKISKSRHKYELMTKPSGALSIFFEQLWERVINHESFKICSSDLQQIAEKLNTIVEQSAAKRKAVIPNVVSYDEPAGQQESNQNKTNSDVTDEDFEIALDLLRAPPTPDNSSNFYDEAPEVNISPALVVQAPIETNVSSSGELYHNGSFVVSGYDQTYDSQVSKKQKTNISKIDSDCSNFYDEAPEVNISPAPVVHAPIATQMSSSDERYHDDGPFLEFGYDQTCDSQVSKKQKTRKRKSYSEDGKTRKFTRDDEILLVKGILDNGLSWKVIYDKQPGLHHIRQDCLKDRARSRRFKAILERTQLDPSLLDRPYELCGSPDQAVYTEHRPTQLTLSSHLEKHVASDSHPSTMSGGEGNYVTSVRPDLTPETDQYYGSY